MRRLAVVATLLFASACGQQEMADQPRFDPLASAPPFENDQAARPVPAGTVPFEAGTAADRPRWSKALILRGRDRFEIYCAPCHGLSGDGDGFIVERGFPAPPSYHAPRLRDADDRHFYRVMTEGYGVMFSYADAVEPSDRWAIVAWIRTLQFSRAAPLSAIPERYRDHLAPPGNDSGDRAEGAP